MSKTIVIVGFGPGISAAMADKFAAEGFSIALVARNQARLDAGVQALKARGAAAAAFTGDAGDAGSIRAAVAAARTRFGAVDVIHWNAYSGADAGDFLAADPAAVGAVFDIAVVGLLAALQEALPDLRRTGGALLVTNGAFGDAGPVMDAVAVGMKVMGVALANAAKHKLVGLLAEQLKPDGVYVGEVMVAGMVKGSAWDNGADGGIAASEIAGKFWELYQARDEVRARVA